MKKSSVTSLIFGALFLLSASVHAAFVSDPCSVTDVTANGSNAFSCVGSIEGNDEASALNGIFGEPTSSIVWYEAAILNLDGETGDHYLEADSGTSGDWTYTGDALSSPFIIVLKAASEYSAYLFKAALSTNDMGDYLISFLNNGGSTPALSHITIYATNSDVPGTGIFGNPVPLPAALWLFGPALLGFMGFRRKIKS